MASARHRQIKTEPTGILTPNAIGVRRGLAPGVGELGETAAVLVVFRMPVCVKLVDVELAVESPIASFLAGKTMPAAVHVENTRKSRKSDVSNSGKFESITVADPLLE